MVSASHIPWAYALLSTLLTSLAPFVILFLIPISGNNEANQPLLRIFLSFAAGGLLGDAFLHLIPHAIPQSHHHTHNQSAPNAVGDEHEDVNNSLAHTLIGLWVLGGIITFFMVEKLIRHVKGGHESRHTPRPTVKSSRKLDDDEDIATEHADLNTLLIEDEFSDKDGKDGEDGDNFEITVRQRIIPSASRSRPVSFSDDAVASHSPPRGRRSSTEEKTKDEQGISQGTGEILVSGYLNLAADFAHNFTDGMAIGASFLAGQGIGWITTITILFHEIPHEIGDFALLLQSGCSKKKAILLQLITIVGAFAGCLVSLFLGSDGNSAPVLAFTAGGFIYIALVSMVPQLLSDVKSSQSMKEVATLLIGIGIMVVIALYG